MWRGIATLLAVSVLALNPCFAEDTADAPEGGGGENASNPLSSVKNTDSRIQYFNLPDGSERWNFWVVDGAFMATDKLKIKYEVHYWNTDITGTNESDFESIHVKGIYFPKKGTWGKWNYKWAVGLEWIKDFDNTAKGIGFGADQFAPFVGVALVKKPGWIFIPLVQQFINYNGTDINTTAARVITLQTLPKGAWVKYDIIVPIDWENDVIPATAEVQLGRMFKKNFGAYADVLLGIGDDRPYDWGVGVGVRFLY